MQFFAASLAYILRMVYEIQAFYLYIVLPCRNTGTGHIQTSSIPTFPRTLQIQRFHGKSA